MTYKVRVERNTLRFSAAHFTTFGGECEPLHGHNYDVVVEIAGALTQESWVMDFGLAKRVAGALCRELDHKFLLQAASTVLGISEEDGAYVVRHAARRYVIPRQDVVPLPLDNTTAERLAEWFARRLAEEFAAAGAGNLESITVGVEEAPGQSGWFTLAHPSAER